MKNYFLVCVVSLALCTSVQAIKPEDYENALNEWQESYPIIATVRNDLAFQGASKKHLAASCNDKNASPLTVFKATLTTVIPYYIKTGKYFSFVEGLDPVWRDAFGIEPLSLRLLTTNENPYEVYYIFGKQH